MAKRFQFTRLIKKYRVPFFLEIVGETYIDDLGEKQTAESVWVARSGALVPLGVRQIEQSGGTLIEADRTLYFTGEFLETGTRIRYGNNIYHVLRGVPHETYADFNSYTVKYVSAFDKVVP
ncbi:hypothetical protein [Exiguobacterium sp. R-39]|uniref:hypothetical protein n=1 Tax=Exiguobacterium sp. R-39 TaxID=3416708 RepID=UPI003CEF12E9